MDWAFIVATTSLMLVGTLSVFVVSLSLRVRRLEWELDRLNQEVMHEIIPTVENGADYAPPAGGGV